MSEREKEREVGKERQNRRKAKGVWERGAEDKGDDDYVDDDEDGTAGYDKFSRFTSACKFLEKVGIYTWELSAPRITSN